MARVLTIQRAIVPPTERATYLAALREQRRHYDGAECRFWVFEASATPGQFVEFAEAQDAAVLTAAVAAAPHRSRAPSPLYNEVELD